MKSIASLKHKKKLTIVLITFLTIAILLLLLLTYKKYDTKTSEGVFKKEEYQNDILLAEEEASFRFLWDNVNSDKTSLGYGLVKDRYTNDRMCSVASVGYALAGTGIGVKNGWITKEEGYERALGTLKTLYYNAEQIEGFFYHFLDMDSGKRYDKVEVSVIDTAICINGALFAGEYFGGEVKELAEQLYLRVNWDWYRNSLTNQFYMEYKPEVGYHTGSWGIYAEQFMLYFLGAASPTHPVPTDMIYNINLERNMWIGIPTYIKSPANSIFTYQFSHAWFDLENKVDNNGYDWYANSVAATLQSRQYSIDTSHIFKTFNSNSWGLTACDGPRGYSGAYGANPYNAVDGTIPPCGAAGSAPFATKYVVEALEYYKTIDGLWGPYGFYDAFNMENDETRIMKDYIGIDKGITMVMIENTRTGFIWDTLSKNNYVRLGLKLTGFTDANVRMIDDFDATQNHMGIESTELNISTTNIKSDGLSALQLKFNGDNKKGTLSLLLEDDVFPDNTSRNTLSQIADTIAVDVLGKADLTIKIYDKDNNLIVETKKVSLNQDTYKTVLFDISEYKSSASSYKKIEFVILSKEETLYIDEIRFQGMKNMVRNVMISERPYVGHELYAEFDYLNVTNSKNTYFTYQWYISDSIQSEFTPIIDGNTYTYTPSENDIGKFLKVRVTPVDNKGTPIGLAQTSSNYCVVTKEKPSVSREMQWKIEGNIPR